MEVETRKPEEIVISFNKTVNAMLSLLEKKSVSLAEQADLDRLRQRVRLYRSAHAEGGRALLCAVGPFLYSYSTQILNREETTFLKIEVGEMKRGDEFVYSLVANIKKMYTAAKQNEKDDIYKKVLGLHTDYIGYCIVTGADPENPDKKSNPR